MKKLNSHRGFLLAILLVIFVGLFLFNHFNGLIVDDLGYSLVDHPFQRVKWEYFNWNGRSIGEFLAMGILLKLPAMVVDVLNTVALMLVLFILERMTTFKKVHTFSIWRYMLLLMLVMVFNVVPGQDFFWTTGAANYLYTSLFALTAVFIFYKQFIIGEGQHEKLLRVLVIPIGILAGWSTENMGGTVVLGGLIFGILAWRKYRHISVSTILLFCVTVVSYLVLILAPGNAARSGDASVNLKDNIVALVSFAGTHYFVFILMYFALLAMLILKSVQKSQFNFNNDLLLGMISLGIMAFANYFALMLSPVSVAPRAHVGFILLLSSAIVLAVQALILDDYSQSLLVIGITGVSLLFIVQGVTGIVQTRQDNRTMSERYDYINAQKKKGNFYPVVAAVDNEQMSKFYGGYQLWDVRKDPAAQFIKDDYVHYFGIKNIYSVTPEVASAFYTNGRPQLMNIQEQVKYRHTLVKEKLPNVQFFVRNGRPNIRASASLKMTVKHFNGGLVAKVKGYTITMFGNKITIKHDSMVKTLPYTFQNYLTFDKHKQNLIDYVSFDEGNAVRGE